MTLSGCLPSVNGSDVCPQPVYMVDYGMTEQDVIDFCNKFPEYCLAAANQQVDIEAANDKRDYRRLVGK